MTKACMWALMGLALCSTAPAEIVTFDNLSDFTPTPISVNSGSITVDFSSPQGPAFFITPASVFSSLTGKVLLDSDADPNELRINFSQPVQTISLLFVLNTPVFSDALTLDAFLGGTAVGSASATGTIPPGFTFPEGTVSFSGSAFDEVRLTSPATDFGIDNVAFTSTVPEPASILLGGAGLAMLIVMKRRARGYTERFR
jgi:hypothetical protein